MLYSVMHNITQFVAKMTTDRQMKYESVTFRPQNSSKAQNPRTPHPKPQPQINNHNPKLQRQISLGRIV